MARGVPVRVWFSERRDLHVDGRFVEIRAEPPDVACARDAVSRYVAGPVSWVIGVDVDPVKWMAHVGLGVSAVWACVVEFPALSAWEGRRMAVRALVRGAGPSSLLIQMPPEADHMLSRAALLLADAPPAQPLPAQSGAPPMAPGRAVRRGMRLDSQKGKV